jgi:hypothetical protein
MDNRNRYRIIVRVIVLVALIIGAKFIMHFTGLEFISINPLFSGIVAANVFLMGFLLSGVLTDFKESERLPGELAAGIENLAQEVRAIKIVRADAEVTSCLNQLLQLSRDIISWFHKKHRTSELMAQQRSSSSRSSFQRLPAFQQNQQFIINFAQPL